MRLSVGTSGYSYKGWRGPFYPEDVPAREMLRFYGEKLPAVEINNTFYRLPKASVLESWAGQVPASFRFAIKASRRITHFKRLKDAGEETGYLLRTTQSLGDRLGAILFQLPPQLRCDTDRLSTFLDLLPNGTRAAFEFRHPSWMDDAVWATLKERNYACVFADQDGEDRPEPVATANWGYLRLRRSEYARADLLAWVKRIYAQDWDEAFVFFKHEDEGAGPKLAMTFLDVAKRTQERKAAVPARAPTRKRKVG